MALRFLPNNTLAVTSVSPPAALLPKTKVCTRCGVSKTRDQFYGRNQTTGWISSRCKDCLRAIGAERRKSKAEEVKAEKQAYHARHRERLNLERRQRYRDLTEQRRATPAPLPALKLCGGCGREKAAAQFNRHAGAADGLSGLCKECAKANTMAWRQAHPERVRIGHNLRRTRMALADGHHDSADLMAIRRRQHDCCAVCKVRLYGAGEIDHIVPLSKGGSNWPKNLQWLCVFCNRSKHNRDPLEFMRQRGFLL